MIVSAQILERRGVDLKTFREEIEPAGQPVVMRDLVAGWPAVRAARESPRALADFLRRFDGGRPVPVIECPPAAGGRIFYRDDMSGFNFIRTTGGIGATMDRLLAQVDRDDAGELFIESRVLDETMPAFPAQHPLPLVDDSTRPRIWIGSRITVQTHFDLFANIACVVGGRRRFTLFPPDQVGNLYLGPFDFTPSGAPVSMVSLVDPDLVKYPRFAEALRNALSAELNPGDGLYIPYAWWHHVQSLTPFNVLVNYWWNPAAKVGSPYAVLLHAALSLRDLPAEQRGVWRAMFDHFVFADPEVALSHLEPEKRGLLGPLTPQRLREVRDILAKTFGKPGA